MNVRVKAVTEVLLLLQDRLAQTLFSWSCILVFLKVLFFCCPSVFRVGRSVSMKDFKSSWRSGEAFLAILCSLRPQLVDLSLVQSRSNQENLEEAFHLAERELHIPRLLEPQGEAD